MNHAVGNVILYILGISLGLLLSRYLYNLAKKKLFVEINSKIVVGILKIVVIIIGFLVGFIVVVILYTIFYILVNGHE